MSTTTSGVKHRKILRDNINGLVNPQIKRLAYRAGATRISGLVYNEVRDILHKKLNTLVKNAIIYMENSRRKTLQVADVEHAIEHEGMRIYGASTSDTKKRRSSKKSSAEKKTSAKKASSGKKRKYHSGTVALRNVRKQQKSTELVFSHIPFSRVIREIAQDYKTDINFSSLAIDALQTYIEDYLVIILEDALLVSINCKRTTVEPKDLRIVMHILRDTR